jgi:DNA polymerase
MTHPLAKTVETVEAHLKALRETDPRPLFLDRQDLIELAGTPGPFRATAARTTVPEPAPPLPAGTDDPGPALAAITERIRVCTLCPLHRTRTRTVPGQGSARPELLFVGEGPGAEEDQQGLAFVGRAGALLTRLIERMGFTREQVHIANIVKCRPTENGEGRKDRAPEPAEVQACLPYLREQIRILRPRVIIALGNVAVEALTGRRGITKLRGHWMLFESVDLMPTYHPSFLLRGGGDEKARYWEVWDDMCEVLRRLNRPVPEIPGRGAAS